MKALFWISVFIIFYHFVGYGVILAILVKFKKKKANLPELKDADLPPVTLLVAAYNEEDIIEDKIKNSLALNYPKDKLKVAFVTDGSSDGTNQIIEKYPKTELYFEAPRNGKISAVNRVMPLIETAYTVFTDANVMINPDGLRKMINHFQDANIAAVSGEKTILKEEEDSASGTGEGFYWKYESFLKRKDSEYNTMVGSAGELFAIRTHLYEPVDKNTLIEDFVITMQLAAQGYKVAYEPGALAMETSSATMADEKKRKVRISAGGIQAVIKLLPLLNFFKYGKLTFQYVSHRVLRWTLMPFALLGALVASVLLASESWFFDVMFRLQIIFYLFAFVGYTLREAKTKIKGLHIPYYFVFMHICVVLGWIKYFRGNQKVTWDKAKRTTYKGDLSSVKVSVKH